jgi:hypothetical protein
MNTKFKMGLGAGNFPETIKGMVSLRHLREIKLARREKKKWID